MNKQQEQQFKQEFEKRLNEQFQKGMLLGGQTVAQMVKDLANEGKTLNEIIHLTEAFTNGTMESVLNKKKKRGKLT